MITKEFLERQRLWLLARLESKEKILKEGGERALLHSPRDLTRISFALRRIAEGQYGLCTNCGIPIAIQRLEVIPETPFCCDCAREIEVH